MFPAFNCSAEEVVIQREKMTFNKCLNVIDVSKGKLSVVPQISEISREKKIAIFTLSDGQLKIECDGREGYVTVSTKMN